VDLTIDLRAADGELQASGEDADYTLAWYRDDYFLATGPDGEQHRVDFLRGADGRVVWLRAGGRLFAHQG